MASRQLTVSMTAHKTMNNYLALTPSAWQTNTLLPMPVSLTTTRYTPPQAAEDAHIGNEQPPCARAHERTHARTRGCGHNRAQPGASRLSRPLTANADRSLFRSPASATKAHLFFDNSHQGRRECTSRGQLTSASNRIQCIQLHMLVQPRCPWPVASPRTI
jgi:hypothetical protein